MEIEGRDEKAAESQEDKYVNTVRLKSGIVKGSCKVTNRVNKCTKKCLQQHSLE